MFYTIRSRVTAAWQALRGLDPYARLILKLGRFQKLGAAMVTTAQQAHDALIAEAGRFGAAAQKVSTALTGIAADIEDIKNKPQEEQGALLDAAIAAIRAQANAMEQVATAAETLDAAHTPSAGGDPTAAAAKPKAETAGSKTVDGAGNVAQGEDFGKPNV